MLAWAETDNGIVAGTRDALYLPDAHGHLQPIRVPWHEVETADWDVDTGALVVREVGTYGLTRPEHHLVVDEPGRLLELVRERVTATIVLTRPVPLGGGRHATVIGRRATSGQRAVAWFVEYDVGLDPDRTPRRRRRPGGAAGRPRRGRRGLSTRFLAAARPC